MKRFWILFVSGAAAVCPAIAEAQSSGWTPPIGIPAPSFGITQTAPPTPSPWTTAVPGFYYIDETRPEATDTSNTYGTPSKPRRTIPLSLPAGSVVELHGTYTKSHRSPSILSLNGTASKPVFVRGRSLTERARATAAWQITGEYFIVENIDFEIDQQLLLTAPLLRGVLRFSSVRGTLTGGSLAVGGGAGSVATEAVIYANSIHDNGDINASVDQDRHGIVISSYVNKVWMLDNRIFRNSGSGVQVNAGSEALQATTQHVYLGRNEIYQTRQAGIGIKQAVDVVASENYIHDIINTEWSPSKCLGYQYAPERVWFIYNHCHNAVFGIYAGSDSGLGFGQNSFIIGNTIHNIHAASFNPGTAWSNAGVMLAGGVNRFVINNTIYDVDNGIQTPGGGSISIVNNIIAGVRSTGSHVFIEHGTTASASTMKNDLFGGTVRIKWGSNTAYNLTSFQSTFGKGQDSINADPQFVNPSGEEFGIQGTSPAVDAGTAEAQPIYDYYMSLYGVDITVDAVGDQRPQDAAWDIGAYEGQGVARPSPPTNLRIIR